MRIRSRSSQAGFTLIELLITIVILAILSGIAILAVGRFRSDANSSSCESDRRLLLTALTGYRANNANGPTQLQQLTSGSTKFVDTTISGNQLVGDGYTLVYDPATETLNGCTAALALGGSGGGGGGSTGGSTGTSTGASTGTSTGSTGAPADTVAPTTANAPTGTLGLNGYFTSNVNVGLTATDSGTPTSGIARIVYQVGSGAAQTVTGSTASASVSTEGTTVITFHAEDVAGNIETNKTVTVMIDKTAPQGLTIGRSGTNENKPVLSGNAGTASTPSADATAVTVSILNVTDNTSAITPDSVSVSGGAWSRAWGGGSGLANGKTYRATVTQVDAAGNSVSVSTANWTT